VSVSASERIAANREMWNETAEIHERAKMQELLDQIARGGFSTLDAIERKIFAELGVARGLDVAQLCCNNARELLSLKLMGAGRAVGFDLSEKFLAQGARLAAAAGVELELVATSVYEVPASYDSGFDVVYVTVGAIGWLPDLAGFLAVVARLLRPGGMLFMYEMHPLLDMFDPDKGLAIEHSYFKTDPYVGQGEPDYFDPAVTVSARSYWHHHRVADLIGGCLRNGLAIEGFEEYLHDVSNVFAHLAPLGKLPLAYTLLARRARHE
jgi:SAM-dependent methyltransferase